MWSLGCVLAQLFGAPMPFAGDNMMQIMMKVVMQRHVPAVPDDAPQVELLRRCFAYAAAERPSAAELSSALTPDTAPRECDLVRLPPPLSGLACIYACTKCSPSRTERGAVRRGVYVGGGRGLRPPCAGRAPLLLHRVRALGTRTPSTPPPGGIAHAGLDLTKAYAHR